MDFKKDNDDFSWKKEDGTGDFDLDAFLNDLDLTDGGTDTSSGQDVPETPDPRPVTGDGKHGRHEAPGQPDIVWEEGMSDPRYAAPERPKVVTRPTVYVTPETTEEYTPTPPRPPQPQASGWGKAILLSLIIVAVILGGILLLSGRNEDKTGNKTTADEKELSAVVSPTPETEEIAVTPAVTDKPAEMTATPQPTEPPKSSHSIQVTAGSGGSISPSGVVLVEEGDSVTFTISADSGYTVRQLLVDGSSVTPAGTYTFSNVTGDHTIYAVFDPEATATPAPTPEPTAEPTPEPTEPPATEPPPTEPPVFETPDPEVEEGLQ